MNKPNVSLHAILFEMSEQVSERTIDKAGWPNGPWMTEPDRVEWQHAGYACLIVRHDRMGQLCGYVGVDSGHPYYGKPYDDCDVTVHGGLTYADKCNDAICHVPAPGMPGDVWWLGFDAAHFQDLVPGMFHVPTLPPDLARSVAFEAKYEKTISKCYAEMEARHLLEDTYRNLDYMRTETEQLAEQLRALVTTEPKLN